MKTLDVFVAILLVIGGLNWGLVGLFNFNLVEYLFGTHAVITRIVYIIVGFCAVFQAFGWKAIQKRWKCS